jgi:hypothetical protein
MGMRSNNEISKRVSNLESAFKSLSNFKVRQRIQSLILLKKEKFKRQADLAEYLGIDRST